MEDLGLGLIEYPNRNRVNTKNNENTTLYTHQINQINIKLDNEDA